MLLTCPTCRSGLQVPDGTTAHVRCPTCKTVFAPAGPPAPAPAPAPPPTPPARPKPLPVPTAPARPATRRPAPAPAEKPAADRPRRKRRAADDGLTPAERRQTAAEFARGAWGARLVWLSLIAYAVSLGLILIVVVRQAVAGATPGLPVAAGALGLVNWVLGAVGVGLCLAGRQGPGHWRFGVSAAVAVVVHAVFLLALVGKGTAPAAYWAADEVDAARWGQVPTRLDTVTFYLTFVFYSDNLQLPKADPVLPVLTGVAEVVRLVLVLVFLSCLARAAGDDELTHRCTRAAGVVSFGPGGLAVVVLVTAAVIAETNADATSFAKVLFNVVMMGIYAILAGLLVPALVAARDTAEACEDPFPTAD